MHRLITCDDVFEILTRGPFPTGQTVEDAEVELHLSGCHDCRQLAEALRPAAGLLRECLAEESLPVFQGSLETTDNLDRPLHNSLPWLGETAPPHPSANTRSVWLAHAARFAGAALLIGLLVGAAQLVAIWRGTPPNAIQLHERLTAAPLPPQCRLALLEGSATDPSRENCCSSCHSAAVAMSTRAPMHRLVATSCRSCHE